MSEWSQEPDRMEIARRRLLHDSEKELMMWKAEACEYREILERVQRQLRTSNPYDGRHETSWADILNAVNEMLAKKRWIP